MRQRSEIEAEAEVVVVEGIVVVVLMHATQMVDGVGAAVDAHLVPVTLPVLSDNPDLVAVVVVMVVADDVDVVVAAVLEAVDDPVVVEAVLEVPLVAEMHRHAAGRNEPEAGVAEIEGDRTGRLGRSGKSADAHGKRKGSGSNAGLNRGEESHCNLQGKWVSTRAQSDAVGTQA